MLVPLDFIGSNPLSTFLDQVFSEKLLIKFQEKEQRKDINKSTKQCFNS